LGYLSRGGQLQEEEMKVILPDARKIPIGGVQEFVGTQPGMIRTTIYLKALLYRHEKQCERIARLYTIIEDQRRRLDEVQRDWMK